MKLISWNVNGYRAVMKKLDAYSPLGYSSAGQVIAVGDEVVVLVVPTINPDGRAAFIDSPNTPSSPRSGVAPRDDDGDGLFDEDDLDDLNGDGHITMMRRRDPNGRWLVSREDPRLMIRARPDAVYLPNGVADAFFVDDIEMRIESGHLVDLGLAQPHQFRQRGELGRA